jgi:hypothetical protein
VGEVINFSSRAESLKRRGFDDEDIDRVERFGRPCVALSAYVEVPNGVVTPDGLATLQTVTSEEARVVLKRQKANQSYTGGKPYKPMVPYKPDEVRPA